MGYIPEFHLGWPFNILFCSVTSGHLSSCEGHFGILLKVWQGNRDAPRGEARDPRSLNGWHRDVGFLSIFKRSQALSPFVTLNCLCLSICQRHVRPPVEMRQGHGAFSRFSTGVSDIHSSCGMKD